jgi:hypothetical protein
MTPWGWANFDPRAFILTNLVDTHYKIFHAKYLSSSSLGFFKKRFFKFFPSIAMSTRVLHGIKSFEQFLKVTTKFG